MGHWSRACGSGCTIFSISSAAFLFGLGLVLLEIMVFGYVLGAPDWTRPVLWATVVPWGIGTLVMFATMGLRTRPTSPVDAGAGVGASAPR